MGKKGSSAQLVVPLSLLVSGRFRLVHLQLHPDPRQDRLGAEGPELKVPQPAAVPPDGQVDHVPAEIGTDLDLQIEIKIKDHDLDHCVPDVRPAHEHHRLPVRDLPAVEDGLLGVAEVADEALEGHVRLLGANDLKEGECMFYNRKLISAYNKRQA